MEIALDFSIPTERAIRVLQAAATASIGEKGVLAKPRPKVELHGTNEFGVLYRIKYFINGDKLSP